MESYPFFPQQQCKCGHSKSMHAEELGSLCVPVFCTCVEFRPLEPDTVHQQSAFAVPFLPALDTVH